MNARLTRRLLLQAGAAATSLPAVAHRRAVSGFFFLAFGRLDASANAYLPLGRRVLSSNRVTVGQLFPFGKSLPGPGEDPRVKILQLRDVTFTAGDLDNIREGRHGSKIRASNRQRSRDDAVSQLQYSVNFRLSHGCKWSVMSCALTHEIPPSLAPGRLSCDEE
jgi:hypothetical protein